MNSAPYLLNEDRPDYERILDEALRDAPHRPDPAAVGQRLSTEQLRTMALNATALIVSAAAAEYDHYVKLRAELRESVRSGLREPGAPDTDRPARQGLGRRLGAALLGAGHAGGPRSGAAVAEQRWGRMSYGRRLLAAVLGLRVRPAVPTPTSVPVPVSTGRRSRRASQREEELAGAREAWREALRERGIMPFLRAALAEPAADPAFRKVPSSPTTTTEAPNTSRTESPP